METYLPRYISIPHHIIGDIIIIITIISESNDDMFPFLVTKETPRPDVSILILIKPSDKAPGLLTSSQCLFASLALSALSPKWASSGVIVGTCKCPVAALRVENTVIGLGLCGTKRAVRLQLILSHPVSSCV